MSCQPTDLSRREHIVGKKIKNLDRRTDGRTIDGGRVVSFLSLLGRTVVARLRKTHHRPAERASLHKCAGEPLKLLQADAAVEVALATRGPIGYLLTGVGARAAKPTNYAAQQSTNKANVQQQQRHQ